MSNQVICNIYEDHKKLQSGIQYYMDMYGETAKVVVKVAPITKITGGSSMGSGMSSMSSFNTETHFLLTLLIFEKHNFNGGQRE